MSVFLRCDKKYRQDTAECHPLERQESPYNVSMPTLVTRSVTVQLLTLRQRTMNTKGKCFEWNQDTDADTATGLKTLTKDDF